MTGEHYSRVSQGGEGVLRNVNRYVPEAPPADPDDWRVEQLLRLYPDYDDRRWVQSMVGWQRLAAEREQALQRLIDEAERVSLPLGEGDSPLLSQLLQEAERARASVNRATAPPTSERQEDRA